ncbi:MAG: hypothetical protein ACU84Q_05245 [Gammaproteobacteria bacterium]
MDFHSELLEGFSVSIGLASFPADAESIDVLISAADAAQETRQNQALVIAFNERPTRPPSMSPMFLSKL